MISHNSVFYLLLLFFPVISGCKVQVRYPSEFPSKTVIKMKKNSGFGGDRRKKILKLMIFVPKVVCMIKNFNTILQSTYTIIS
ncbi:MAG: hypothetical protein CM1200mP30_15420 [Pseudomonadota bacterium]|nr:MAG: hypothetical protein CM1200mP30_15420 [Pseudomonadota bacterium]